MTIETLLTDDQWMILTDAYDSAQEEWPFIITKEIWHAYHADFAILRDLGLMDCAGDYPSNIWELTDTGAAWVEKRQDAMSEARKHTAEKLAAWNKKVTP